MCGCNRRYGFAGNKGLSSQAQPEATSDPLPTSLRQAAPDVWDGQEDDAPGRDENPFAEVEQSPHPGENNKP